jgi:hypothetical protein
LEGKGAGEEVEKGYEGQVQDKKRGGAGRGAVGRERGAKRDKGEGGGWRGWEWLGTSTSLNRESRSSIAPLDRDGLEEEGGARKETGFRRKRCPSTSLPSLLPSFLPLHFHFRPLTVRPSQPRACFVVVKKFGSALTTNHSKPIYIL